MFRAVMERKRIFQLHRMVPGEYQQCTGRKGAKVRAHAAQPWFVDAFCYITGEQIRPVADVLLARIIEREERRRVILPESLLPTDRVIDEAKCRTFTATSSPKDLQWYCTARCLRTQKEIFPGERIFLVHELVRCHKINRIILAQAKWPEEGTRQVGGYLDVSDPNGWRRICRALCEQYCEREDREFDKRTFTLIEKAALQVA